MERKQNAPGDFDIRKAMELAGTPAGQQLIALMRSKNGATLQQAMNTVASGDYGAARAALAGLLEDPQIQGLLRQLEGRSDA